MAPTPDPDWTFSGEGVRPFLCCQHSQVRGAAGGPSMGSNNGNGNAADSVFQSRINVRMCSKCKDSFWAWDSKRTQCLLCAPLPKKAAERILSTVYS